MWCSWSVYSHNDELPGSVSGDSYSCSMTHADRHNETESREAHGALIQKINAIRFIVTMGSKLIANVSSCHFLPVDVSQLPNAATCIASPKIHKVWSSCKEWSWMGHVARTRTLTASVCAGSVRWVAFMCEKVTAASSPDQLVLKFPCLLAESGLRRCVRLLEAGG